MFRSRLQLVSLLSPFIVAKLLKKSLPRLCSIFFVVDLEKKEKKKNPCLCPPCRRNSVVVPCPPSLSSICTARRRKFHPKGWPNKAYVILVTRVYLNRIFWVTCPNKGAIDTEDWDSCFFSYWLPPPSFLFFFIVTFKLTPLCCFQKSFHLSY